MELCVVCHFNKNRETEELDSEPEGEEEEGVLTSVRTEPYRPDGDGSCGS